MLDITELDFEDYYNKTPYLDDKIKKEKYNIFCSYYNFIYSDAHLSAFKKIKNNLDESETSLKEFNEIISVIFIKFFSRNNYEIQEFNSDELINYSVDEFKNYLIYNNIFMIDKLIYKLIFEKIGILSDNKIIKTRKIILTGNKYRSLIFYSYKLPILPNNLNELFNISYTEYTIIIYNEDVYVTTFHYSKLFEISRKNIKSNKKFKNKENSYILNKINTKLYVDIEFQNLLLKRLNQKYNYIEILNKKEQILNILKIKYQKETWSLEWQNEISNLQEEYSKLNEVLILYEFASFFFEDEYIIFVIFQDFRGRKYYNSLIGPTFSKHLRYAYHYGQYTVEEIENKKEEINVTRHKSEIEIWAKNNNINIKNGRYVICYWALIGIGKIFINKNKKNISELEFLQTGMQNFNYDALDIDLEELLKLDHYKLIIANLNSNSIYKRAIAKDATMSIYQMFIKELGPKNENSLNLLNITGENVWTDTYLIHKDYFYTYIKNDAKLSIKLKKFTDIDIFNKYLKRKYIKKFIMIIPYNAGKKLCQEHYLNELRKDNIDIEKDEITYENIKKFTDSLYIFIKKKIQTLIFFKKETSSWIENMSNEFELNRICNISSNTGETDMSYFKMKKSTIDIKIKTKNGYKRITKMILIPTNSIDIHNFNTSIAPNIAHFMDGDEIRELEKDLGYSVITIHDCYLIDCLNCDKLIKIRQLHFTKILSKFGNYESNNIFILL